MPCLAMPERDSLRAATLPEAAIAHPPCPARAARRAPATRPVSPATRGVAPARGPVLVGRHPAVTQALDDDGSDTHGRLRGSSSRHWISVSRAVPLLTVAVRCWGFLPGLIVPPMQTKRSPVVPGPARPD